jgi:hypothetical protein
MKEADDAPITIGDYKEVNWPNEGKREMMSDSQKK